ncbi:MAG: polyhydroxyalkanoate synthesis regulator DNA-binding domain-containing protein [Acidimicrobiia bacterium]
MPEPVRLIKRYANRKLYDTGSGELTSLRGIERLLRDGVDIRVVDHDTGQDMTGEVLVGILGNSVGERPAEGDVALLTSLIRTPGDVLAAMFQDEKRTEELRAMGERVRLLSATIDALLGQMEDTESSPAETPAPPAPKRKAAAAKKPAAGRQRA